MVSTDHTKMVKCPPWARILHLPYLPIPIAKEAFFFCRVANFNALGRDVLW